jgi:hypothetical protein
MLIAYMMGDTPDLNGDMRMDVITVGEALLRRLCPA